MDYDKLKQWIIKTYWDAAQVAGWARSNFYPRTSHQQTSNGTASSGLPIVLDADGKVDATFLDSADLAAQIHAATNKATIVANDEFPIADSAASYGLKHVLFSVVRDTIKSYYDSVAATLTNKTFDSTNISTLTSKTTPVNADSVVLVDSAASNVFKGVTGTNLKAYLKTYLDTLYVALTGAQTIAGVKNFTNGISIAAGTTMTVFAQGTWTPVLRFGTGTTGITYGTQTGTYMRIGNRVWVHCTIILTSKGSSTGSADITGLPYTVVRTTNCLCRWRAMATSYVTLLVLPLVSTTTLVFRAATAAATAVDTDLTDANFNNTSSIIFEATYEV